LINAHGYQVAILDVDKERVQREADRLGSSKCIGLHVDITDYDQQAQAFLQTFEWGGNRLDFFFANAGIGDTDSLYKDMSGIDEKTGLPKPLDLRTMDVNLDAVVQGIHLARHFFAERNTKKAGGKILVTSSVIGVYANHPMPLYSASKYGVVGLVRALAPVYLKDGITINCICPTLIETNLMPKHVTREFHVPVSPVQSG
jgi:15-hydroxyprostaglandin dehydrogenase (NAD)